MFYGDFVKKGHHGESVKTPNKFAEVLNAKVKDMSQSGIVDNKLEKGPTVLTPDMDRLISLIFQIDSNLQETFFMYIYIGTHYYAICNNLNAHTIM